MRYKKNDIDTAMFPSKWLQAEKRKTVTADLFPQCLFSHFSSIFDMYEMTCMLFSGITYGKRTYSSFSSSSVSMTNFTLPVIPSEIPL